MRHVRLLVVGFMLSLTVPVVSAVAADFTQSGPFAVGRQEFKVPDVSGNRPLATWVWYPVSPEAGQASSTATPDAPPATTGSYPLVVLIHGLSGRGMTYSAWGEHLATYGFVVIAANYDAGLTAPPDAGVSAGDKVPRLLLYERPADVVRVIKYADTLTAPGGPLAGVIDTSRIGVWGHSTGGTTALQAGGARIDFSELAAWCAANESEAYGESCQFVGHEPAVGAAYGAADPFAGPLPALWDSRVAALVLAAPGGELQVFGETGIAAVQVPTLAMVASDDGVVKPGINALWAYAHIASPDKALAVFDRGGHLVFLGQGPLTDETRALTTAFFLDILKHDPAAKDALRPGGVSFPGLTYETTLH